VRLGTTATATRNEIELVIPADAGIQFFAAA